MLTDSGTDSTTLVITGEKSPHFRCSTIDGKPFDLSGTKGKIVLITFFATWCNPCKQELSLLQSNIWNKYSDDPRFSMIVIGRQHSEEDIREFARTNGYQIPFAADPDRAIYSLFATQYIPRNIILDADGKILFHNRGFSGPELSEIERVIAERLKQIV